MDPAHIQEMITTNREYIKLKSNIALQNLAMLHRSFDSVEDEECVLGLLLNDSIASLIFNADYGRAIEISEGALHRYPDTQLYYLLAYHQSVIGRSYIFLLKYDLARDYLIQAEVNALKAPMTQENKALIADILHDLAMNNHHAGWDKEVSMVYLDRALEMLMGTRYLQRRGVYLMGKGNVRFNQERVEEALQYYIQAEAFLNDAESFGNPAAILCNIGMCYANLGRIEDAEPNLMRALDLRMRLGSYWEIANSYYNLFLFYRIKGDLAKAYEMLLTARDYALISHTKGLKLMILKDLEQMALDRGDHAAADQHRQQYLEVEK
jgi:tetratricopeptide (TPR) repeat protein